MRLIEAAKQQVRKYVIRREVQPKGEGKKPYTKAPKIQRLVTPQRLQHKRHRAALKRRQSEKVKDEAVSRAPVMPCTQSRASPRRADPCCCRTSTPRSWPSALPRPRPTRPTLASDGRALCASKRFRRFNEEKVEVIPWSWSCGLHALGVRISRARFGAPNRKCIRRISGS